MYYKKSFFFGLLLLSFQTKIKTRKISLYYISPLYNITDDFNKLSNETEQIQIKFKNDIIGTLNQQSIIGEGQSLFNITEELNENDIDIEQIPLKILNKGKFMVNQELQAQSEFNKTEETDETDNNEEKQMAIDSLNIQSAVAQGQIVGDKTILKKNTLYKFSKVTEKICQDKPFFKDEKTNISFYEDDCNYYVYTCDDGTVISTDSKYLKFVREMVEDACKIISSNNGGLKKRNSCSANDYFNIFKGVAQASSPVFFTLLFSPDPVTKGALFGLGVATAISMLSFGNCFAKDPNDTDVCCSMNCFNGGYIAATVCNPSCIEVW
ncbi:hypothetical protein PIROE2DRAFT_7956 [Piromyces sp. E2]|nr:hypothetical protein PIROE2DRAFT_7956 [Piromyces sp. E2]|eukprot:OUM65068.1 hypothetical protein PIROE2DRAFT_7956 [Piromyces sp. E2]